MAPPLLTLDNIHLTFGGHPLLAGAGLNVEPGERICLVGRNGCGKSTLLKIAAGLIEPDQGTCFVHPGATIRYLPQEPDLSGFPTTLAYAEAGMTPGDDHHRARYLLETLGLTGEENPATLSGGEARRAALARALAPEPDVLLLDEPTNHLDLPAIEWLEGELKSLRSALVLISHDRRFLQALSRATVWLDRGRTRRLDAGFTKFEDWRDEVLRQEEVERHKLDRKIVAEEHWVRYGVSARRTRNMRRMRELDALRDTRRTARRAQGNVRMVASEAESSGARVIEAKGISKSFGDLAIVKNLDLIIERGDRVALVGANGAGKSTLIALLTGALAPDAGAVKLGTNLAIVHLDQRRAALDPDATLTEVLTGGRGDQVVIGGQARHVVSYMKDFLFAPEQARTPVSALSGGERGRLMLARAFAMPSNLMVLDEPTNDLDLETLDLLQELIADYAGTVLLVSHDRDFLDRVATTVLFADGEGRWLEYAGGYSDMLAQRGSGVSAREARKDKPAAKPAAPAPVADKPAPKRRLTMKEIHALKTLPGEIDKLSGEIAALRGKLDDPAFYGRDPQGFAKVSQQLADAEHTLAEREDEWLRLEMLREELGA